MLAQYRQELRLCWLSTGRSSGCVGSVPAGAQAVLAQYRQELRLCWLSTGRSSGCVGSVPAGAQAVLAQYRQELRLCWLSTGRNTTVGFSSSLYTFFLTSLCLYILCGHRARVI